MKKLYLMLAFVMAFMLSGWHEVQAQMFREYDFATGVDASRWITLTAPQTVMGSGGSTSALSGDDVHSDLMSLGFSMPLGTRVFTHWYATSNGYIGLGDATTTPEHGSYSNPFNSLSGARLAIIDALGCDGYITANTAQGVKYQMFADANDTVFVIEYCNGTYNNDTRNYNYHVQFQLRKSTRGVTIVYGPRPATLPAVQYQTGISYNGTSDYVLINTTTHTHTWMSAGSTVNNAAGTWPEANRYYEIVYDTTRCPSVAGLTASNVAQDGAMLHWNHVSTLSAYRVVCGSIDTIVSTDSLQLTGLNGGTVYTASVYTLCDTTEFSTPVSGAAASVTFTTLCAATQVLPYSEDFNGYTTGTTSWPMCWTKVHANGNYPYIYSNTSYSLHRGTEVNYMYTYCANATVYTMAASPAFLVPTNGLEVHVKVSTSTVNGRAYLGYMTDVTDESTFVPVSTFTPTVAGDAKELVMILDRTHAGDTVYPTIKLQNATSTCYYGVDDFWAREVSVNQLPFYEDFNNYSITNYVQPAGMTMVHGYNQTYRSPYIYNTATYGLHTSADVNYLYSYCANANQYGLMASPAFVVPQAGIEVYLKARLSTATGRVQLGYMTDLSDENSFRPVVTFTPTVASEYRDMIMRTADTLVGDTIYVAIRYQNASGTCYYGFDDLEIRENMNGLENLPYTFDFNTARTASITWNTNPFAMYRRWTPVLHYSNYPYVYTTANYAPDGSYYMYHYVLNGNPYLMAMPPVRVPNEGLFVTMQAKANNTYASVQLGYMTDPTNQNSFVAMNTVASSTGTQTLYYWLDNASVIGQVVYPAYRLQYVNGTTYVGIDNIQVKAATACRPVATIIMNNDTSGGFTVRWSETVGGLGSTFDVAYNLANDLNSATVVEGITADSLQLRDLAPGGTYYVWVRNHCGGDILPWVSGGSHTVICDPYYALPIRENFDSYTSNAVRGNIPFCWDVPAYANTTSIYPYISSNSTYASSGTMALYCYVTTNQSFTVRTKPFLLPAEGVMGKLKVRYSSGSTGAHLRFGVMTNPNDVATFQPISTYAPITLGEKEEMYFYYGSESLVGQPIYAAIQMVYVNGYAYCYVDDVEIEVATACRPATDITYDNVTPTSMTVNWVDNSASPDTYYQVAYSLNHMRDDANLARVIDNVTTTSVNLTGLYPGMRYRTWVRKMCGSTALPWVDGPAIEMPCQGYTLPVVETFDQQFANSPTTMTPNCWTLLSGNSYNIVSNSTYAHSGNYSMYLPLTGTGSEARVASPSFRMPTSGLLYGNIHAYTSTDQVRITLGVMSDLADASTYRAIKTYIPTTAAVDNDIYFYVDSIPAAGEDMHLVITATSFNGTVNVYVDDIELREGTSCHRVYGTTYSNVRAGAMHISWLDETHADSSIYQVAYGTTNNVASATVISNVRTMSIDLTGLTMDANYYVWVRNICGTDTLYWDQIGPIRVPYTPDTLPYVETFESYASGTANFPTHWWKLTANGNYPYVYSTAGYNTTTSGTKVLYSYITSNVMTTMVASRGILLPDTGVVVSMNAAFSGVNHVVELGYLTDINDPSSFVVKSTVTSSVVNNTAAAEKDHLFFYFDDPNLYDSVVYIAVRHSRVAGAGNAYLGIDDLKVEVAPACRYASNVRYTNVEAGTVTVRWEDNSRSPGTYQIIYGTSATRSSAVDTISNITLTNYYPVYGLDTNRDYYFWVRSICTEPSPWATGGKVHVPCVESPLPYFNDFTGLSTGTAQFPNCWTKVISNGSYPYLSGSYYTGTSPAIYSYHTSTAPVMYATVPVRMPGTGLYFQCDVNQSNINGEVTLGVMTNPSDPSTFVPMKRHYADANGAGKESFFYYDNDALANQIIYGAVKSSGNTAFYFGVDNVYMSEAGTCRRLSDIRICESTVNSATVCWSDNSPSMSYDVAYSTTNSTTDVANMHFMYNVFDTSCVLQDLSIGTTYYVWVRNHCIDTLMPWSPSVSFTTPCGDIEGRYEQSFDGYAANVFPNCWTNVNTQPTSPVTISNATYANSGMMSLRLAATADTALVASPRVALPANQIHVMFNSYPSTTTSVLEAGYMTDVEDASTFVPLYVARDLNTSQEMEHEFYTDNVLTTDTIYIAFRLTSVRPTVTSYVYLDDILIEPATDCRRPVRAYVTDLTHESAVLNFDPYNATDNSFEIRYGTDNNPMLASNFLPVSSSPVMLSGLTPNTTYYAFVRTRCFYDSTSWKAFPAFTTLPTCSEITSITPDVAFRGVNLTWEISQGGMPIYGYEVTYTYGSTSTTVIDTVFSQSFAIINTDTNELISYQVKVLCGASELDITEGGSMNGEVITRQECDHPTEMMTPFTTAYLPVFTYSAEYGGYSYSQQIFYNSEIATLGDTLTSISFRSATSSINRRWQLFLGNTDQDNLEEWVPYDSLRAVTPVREFTFTGAGWITINFDTVFVRRPGANLCVALLDSTGTVVGIPFYVATHTNSSRRCQLAHGVAICPDPANPDGAEGVRYYASYVNDVRFGSRPNCAIPECSAPLLAIDSTTDSSISISWTPVDTVPATYYLSMSVGNSGVFVPVDTVNTNYYTFRGLVRATTYVLRVERDCGVRVAGQIKGQTDCALAPVPFTEDFETASLGSPFNANCWLIESLNPLGYDERQSQATRHPIFPYCFILTGQPEDQLLKLMGGSWVATPKVAAPLNQLELYFTQYVTDTNYYFYLGYLTDDNTSYDSIVWFDTVYRRDYFHLQENLRAGHTVDLWSLPDNASRIVFASAQAQNSIYNNYYGEITLRYPAACAPVTNVTASNVTSNSATITWDHHVAGSGYIVEYGMRMFVRGTGTVVRIPDNGPRTITLTGLDGSSLYDVYVTAICPQNDPTRTDRDTSEVSSACGFQTLCGNINTLPYVYNFNEYRMAGTIYTHRLPACWAFDSVYTHAINQDSMPNMMTVSAMTGDMALMLSTPTVVGTAPFGMPLDTLMMTFTEYAPDPETPLLIGAVDSLDQGFAYSFVGIDTMTYTPGVTFYNRTVYLVDYAGNAQNIAFKTLPSANNRLSMHRIDNLVISYAPPCLPVRDLRAIASTDTSITLTWRDYRNPTAWIIEYGVAGFTLGTGTTVNASSRPFTLTGLQSNTTYDIYVRPACSATPQAEWSPALRTTTECSVYGLPYAENFNRVEATPYDVQGNAPDCWKVYSDGSSRAFLPHVVDTLPNWNSPDASAALVMTSGIEPYGNTSIAVLPMFARRLSDLYVTFWYSTASEDNGTLTVGYVTGNDFATTFYPVRTLNNNTTGTFDTVKFNILSENTTGRIALRWINSTSYNSVSIDNLVVDTIIPPCPHVDSVVVNTTYRTATVTWIGDSTEVIFHRGNTFRSDEPSMTITNGRFTVDTLTMSTDYVIGLRTLCYNGTRSGWDVFNVRTDTLICHSPNTVSVDTVSYRTATISWTNDTTSHRWEISAYSTIDTLSFIATNSPFEITGLTQGRTYNVIIRSLCGTEYEIEGAWADDTVTFTTRDCLPATGLTVGTVTAITAEISWAAPATASGTYIVNYGLEGFPQGFGNFDTVYDTHHTITGLEANTAYDVYVASVCEGSINSVWTSAANFITDEARTFHITVRSDNERWGTVTGSGDYEEGSTVQISATAARGYHFVEWNDHDSNATRSIYVTGDATYTAFFAEGEGIDDVNADNDIMLYPNPASTTVTVLLKGVDRNAKVSIVDMNGRQINQWSVENGESVTVDVSNLSQGAYFVRVVGDRVNAIRKLIVR